MLPTIRSLRLGLWPSWAAVATSACRWALAFARKGYHVDLLDTSAERVALVNTRHMPFHEDDAEPLLAESIRTGAQGDHRPGRPGGRLRRHRHHRHAR